MLTIPSWYQDGSFASFFLSASGSSRRGREIPRSEAQGLDDEARIPFRRDGDVVERRGHLVEQSEQDRKTCLLGHGGLLDNPDNVDEGILGRGGASSKG